MAFRSTRNTSCTSLDGRDCPDFSPILARCGSVSPNNNTRSDIGVELASPAATLPFLAEENDPEYSPQNKFTEQEQRCPNRRIAQLLGSVDGQHSPDESLIMDEDGASHEGSKQKRNWKSGFNKALRGWWLWEISGAVLSIGCMAVIVIILPYIHNQPLQSWRFMVAPNTMISTFVTISKTSMQLAVAAGIGQPKWRHFRHGRRPIPRIGSLRRRQPRPLGRGGIYNLLSFSK
ncbi:hypothetical protein B0J12DRAFT_701617 [Macrophomina phaseolina]|uniref:Uncharacterized protein n=1 Tax=Macrophomina phaseolina TaxID=35725 RepID=A0ABQ8G575_9PEZI|nr:hypothetical protein B0J12DRAFT_701617 [Macrophomina phaseolina]